MLIYLLYNITKRKKNSLFIETISIVQIIMSIINKQDAIILGAL
jgi:hypothetical protein